KLRKLERSTRLGNSVVRMIENTGKGAHPLVDITSDRDRNFRYGELRRADHVFYRLTDVESRILFSPNVNVVQRHVPVLHVQSLVRHDCEHVRNVMAVLLSDFDRRTRGGIAARLRAGTDEYDHVLETAVADLYSFGCRIVRSVHLAV